MACNSWSAAINKDNEVDNTNISDLQTSATSAKFVNLGSLFGYGNNGYPNYNRPNYYPNYNTNGGFYPSTGKYPITNNGGYYPNNNYYPPTTGTGTNILGGSGYGGYGGYGGNGGLQQYYGYLDPNYSGRRNLGYGYYTNTNSYGLPKTTNDHYGSRERDRVTYSYRGYE
ncbi:uncharacterized protein LOC135954016 [Calliphora vicina]|uniref:uncharacterized protein LOC135954016 n=1 Tax=Calliphora vicina TaxID=7373 RepID=UPI00325B3C57